PGHARQPYPPQAAGRRLRGDAGRHGLGQGLHHGSGWRMSLPSRHSLLWPLSGAMALFCLLLVSLHVDMGRLLTDATSYLPESTRKLLRDYAREAETAWQENGAIGVDAFLRQLQEREQVWAVVVDEHKQSLSTRSLTAGEVARLDFLRKLEFPVGRRGSTPTFYVPFED